MDNDAYESKIKRISVTIQTLKNERDKINMKLKTLEAEREEIINDFSLAKIRKSKDNPEWTNKQFSWSDEINKILKETFSLKEFRPKQLSAINATLSGKDVLLLMPTGGGKSLVYQLTACISKGVTLVISPLISLIDDQLRALREINIKAATINSHDSQNKGWVYKEMINPNTSLKLLYVTPEWVAKSKMFMNSLQKCYDKGCLSRIVIDEVHCCSSWGHDFRTDYNQLSMFKTMFGDVPIIGLTATATMNIMVDIQKMLCLENPLILTAPFNRPNLYYEVIYKPLEKNKCISIIANWLGSKYVGKSGIIYCTTVKDTEDVANELKANGIKAKPYHAQINNEARKIIYDRWIENKYQVIVATVAFGMGIDKSDVSFVIHYSIPKSMEALYQESGRAGRNGQPADCILFFNISDYLRISSMAQSKIEEANTKNLLCYCVEQFRCRRALIAEHFEDTWRRTDCKKMCDHCRYVKPTLRFCITEAAVQIQKILEIATIREIKVTILKLLSCWFYEAYKEIRPSDLKKPRCTKQVAEHIVAFLISRDYLIVEKGFTLYTTLGYIQKNNKRPFNEVTDIIIPYSSEIGYPVVSEEMDENVDVFNVSSTTTDSEQINKQPKTPVLPSEPGPSNSSVRFRKTAVCAKIHTAHWDRFGPRKKRKTTKD